jgi:hypothetical protein
MRYATVNKNGKIVGMFFTQPELLEHRPLKENEFIVECPTGTMETMYYNGSEIVERSTIELSHTLVDNVIQISNLPNNTEIRIINSDGIQIITANNNTEITLSSGINLLEIDPWPYLHTRIIVNVE